MNRGVKHLLNSKTGSHSELFVPLQEWIGDWRARRTFESARDFFRSCNAKVALCMAGGGSGSRIRVRADGSAQSGSIRTSGFSLVETLAVDATEAPRKVFHARLTIPATAGDFVLLYPKWIPGEHGPTGPVVDTAGIYFRANGRALNWHRDPVDMYAYHVEVPPGATSIDATLDYLSPVEMPGNFSARLFGNREACGALLELDGSLSQGVRLG